jgi:hypothetical protein
MVSHTSIHKARELISEALKLLGSEDAQSTGRNAEWFRDTGHLSDKGIEHIERLFAQGATPYRAANELGISYRAASERQKSWLKKRRSEH